MTNFEKWRDECIDILEGRMSVVGGKPARCGITDCKVCLFCGCGNCRTLAREWLLAEYQEPAPKLTRREREFLKCFTHPFYKKIFRNDYGLYVAACEPGNGLSISYDMFPFINSGEIWALEDLLKLEVEE